MIDINELKPILSEILTDENSVDIIEKIQAIDKPGVTQADLDKLDNEWKERYRKAFFDGVEIEKQADGNADDGSDDIEEDEEKMNYDDLFSEESEGE
jgi:hypothetical protein